MEIVATPLQRRKGRLLVRGLAALTVLVLVLLLIPAALGLERHVIHDRAMAGSLARGTLVFGDHVPVQALRVGDVITFRSPADPDRFVTRRIVGLREGRAVTRGDARAWADPWLLPLDDEGAARVAVTIPWLGHPWLLLTGSGLLGAVLAAVGLGGLALGGLMLRRRARAAARESRADAGERVVTPGARGAAPLMAAEEGRHS